MRHWFHRSGGRLPQPEPIVEHPLVRARFFVADVDAPDQLMCDMCERIVHVPGVKLHHMMTSLILAQDQRWRRA